MSRRSRRAGQLATLALIGLLIVAFPAGFALAQDLADRGATTQSNHTVVPIINLTSTPTETPTATATQTATPTPTPTATPTPTSGGDNGDGDGDTSGNGQRLVVDKGSGAAGGVTSESDCSNANYTMIQRAVDDAAPGDTVMVCAGTYVESVTVERANITLLGDGEVVIESLGQTAIQTDAPGVTIRGFTIRAAEAIAVGGRDSLLRDNTIEPIGPDSTGIFLSDGFDERGQPDPELGAATGSRVVNNTVTAGTQTRYGVFSDADQAVVRANSFSGEDNTTSIRSSGNKSVIRDNTVHHPVPCQQCEDMPGAIVIGPTKSPPWTNNGAAHNWANRNLIVNNSVSRSPGEGMIIGWKHVQTRHENRSTWSYRLDVAKETVVRNNTLFKTAVGFKKRSSRGLVGHANGAVYRNNTVISTGGEGNPFLPGMAISGHNVLVIGNTFKRNGGGLRVLGPNITVKKNTITNSVLTGIGVKTRGNGTHAMWNTRVRLINNKVTGSKHQSGVYLLDNTHVTEFHHNQLTDNAYYGVRIATNNFTISEFHHNLIDIACCSPQN